MSRRDLGLHLALVAVLCVLNFMLPAYHQGLFARIMVLAVYAIGYNIAFGYTGLLSLGHAMFFAAGMYGAGLSAEIWGLSLIPAWLMGVVAGGLVSLVVGALALRTRDVAFMIVTLMFSQAAYMLIMYFGNITHADDGFVVPETARVLFGVPVSQPELRYGLAWGLFSVALMGSLWLVRSPFGRTLVAIRENEERTRLLGYDTTRRKLGSVVISGTVSAASGAAYGLLFGYVGASFAGVQYSILALLWVLLGGAGTVLGPFVGTLFMYYVIEFATDVTPAYMLIAGVVLVLLTLFAPQGLMGELRRRVLRGLP